MSPACKNNQDLEDMAEEIKENLDEQGAEYERNILEEIELVIHNTCGICDADYVGSTRCSTCANFCHDTEPCSTVEKDGDLSKVVCQSCLTEKNIVKERNLACNKQEKQANRMLSVTAKHFKPREVGENVSVPIPDVDRGRGEFRNVLGVITEVGNDGMYNIGTTHGTLKQKYTRSRFVPNKVTSVEVSDVPDTEVNLGSGQGFRRCGCVTGCSEKTGVVVWLLVSCAIANAINH